MSLQEAITTDVPLSTIAHIHVLPVVHMRNQRLHFPIDYEAKDYKEGDGRSANSMAEQALNIK